MQTCEILTFDTPLLRGQYCLTEVGHGLDAFHLETTATLLPNGEFELNTPSERAAKYVHGGCKRLRNRLTVGLPVTE